MVRKRSRATPLICTIDVTGFAGVMLALLAMFMGPILSWPDLSPRGNVDLPEAHNPVVMRGANREDALVIAVQRDGRIWIDQDRVMLEDLPAKIRERLVGGAERKVYLKVDRAAKYGVVISVLDVVRSAGVENIGFLVYARTAKTLGP